MTALASNGQTAYMNQIIAEDSALAQVIEKGIKIVFLQVQGIPGRRKVKGTRVLIGDQELDDKRISSPTIDVLTEAWTSRFTAVKGKLQRAVKAHSVSGAGLLGSMDGFSAISALSVPEVQAKIAEIEEQDFKPLVGDLCGAYPSLIEEVRQLVNNEASWSTMRITPVANVRAGLRIVFRVMPFTFLSEAGKKFADEVAQSIVEGLAQDLEQEASRFKQRASAPTFQSDTLNSLKTQFEKLKAFSFLASGDVKIKLQEAEAAFGELGAEPARAINAAIKSRDRVIDTLSSALAGLSKEVRTDAGGRFRRSIKV